MTREFDEPALVPWEAFDPSHPDHADWVRDTGKCFSQHDHTEWVAAGCPTDEEDDET